jgi:hypothetical protein
MFKTHSIIGLPFSTRVGGYDPRSREDGAHPGKLPPKLSISIAAFGDKELTALTDPYPRKPKVLP